MPTFTFEEVQEAPKTFTFEEAEADSFENVSNPDARNLPDLTASTRGGPRVPLPDADVARATFRESLGEGFGDVVTQPGIELPSFAPSLETVQKALDVTKAASAYETDGTIPNVPTEPSKPTTAAKVITGGIEGVDELARSVVAFFTSGPGMIQLGVAATPLAPAVYAKWTIDMLNAGTTSVLDAWDAFEKSDYRKGTKDTVIAFGSFLGAGAAARHGYKKLAPVIDVLPRYRDLREVKVEEAQQKALEATMPPKTFTFEEAQRITPEQAEAGLRETLPLDPTTDIRRAPTPISETPSPKELDKPQGSRESGGVKTETEFDKLIKEVSSTSDLIAERKAKATKYYQYDFQVEALKELGLPESFIDNPSYSKLWSDPETGANRLQNTAVFGLLDIGVNPKTIADAIKSGDISKLPSIEEAKAISKKPTSEAPGVKQPWEMTREQRTAEGWIDLWHGTTDETPFNTFKKSDADAGVHLGTREQAEKRVSNKVGKRFIKAYIKPANILEVRDVFGTPSPEISLAKELRKKGVLSGDELNEFLTRSKTSMNAPLDMSKVEITKDNVRDYPGYESIFDYTITHESGKKETASEGIGYGNLKDRTAKSEVIRKMVQSRLAERINREPLLRELEDKISKAGYDTLSYRNAIEGEGGEHNYSFAVIDPANIKLEPTPTPPVAGEPAAVGDVKQARQAAFSNRIQELMEKKKLYERYAVEQAQKELGITNEERQAWEKDRQYKEREAGRSQFEIGGIYEIGRTRVERVPITQDGKIVGYEDVPKFQAVRRRIIKESQEFVWTSHNEKWAKSTFDSSKKSEKTDVPGEMLSMVPVAGETGKGEVKPEASPEIQVVGKVEGMTPDDISNAILEAVSEGGMVQGIKKGGDKSGHYVVAPADKTIEGDLAMAVGPFESRKAAQDFLDSEVGAEGAKVVEVKPTPPVAIATQTRREALQRSESDPTSVMREQLTAARKAIQAGTPIHGDVARGYEIIPEIIKAGKRFAYDPKTDTFVPAEKRFTLNPEAWSLVAKLDALDIRQKTEGETKTISDSRRELTQELAEAMGFNPVKETKPTPAPPAGEPGKTIKPLPNSDPDLRAEFRELNKARIEKADTPEKQSVLQSEFNDFTKRRKSEVESSREQVSAENVKAFLENPQKVLSELTDEAGQSFDLGEMLISRGIAKVSRKRVGKGTSVGKGTLAEGTISNYEFTVDIGGRKFTESIGSRNDRKSISDSETFAATQAARKYAESKLTPTPKVTNESKPETTAAQPKEPSVGQKVVPFETVAQTPPPGKGGTRKLLPAEQEFLDEHGMTIQDALQRNLIRRTKQFTKSGEEKNTGYQPGDADSWQFTNASEAMRKQAELSKAAAAKVTPDEKLRESVWKDMTDLERRKVRQDPRISDLPNGALDWEVLKPYAEKQGKSQPTPAPPAGEVATIKSKAALIDELLGSKPVQSVANAEARVRWDKDAKELSKRSRAELETIASDKKTSEARESELAASTREIIPEVDAIAKEGGPSWRTVLREKADAEGVRFPTAQGMSRGDVVYSVSRAIAERRRSNPAPPPTPQTTAEKPTAEVKGETGGVPYYRQLGAKDALDQSRKRMRPVPQNFKLAYIDGWYAARKEAKAQTPQPAPPPIEGKSAPEVKGEGGEPIRLTPKQMEAAKSKIKKHYNLDRAITDSEVVAEIENLRRKEAKGNLDDSQERLLASLEVGKQPIEVITKTPTPPPIEGMGGAIPEEFKPSQQPPTALKNAAVDAQRAARGETPLMKSVRQSNPELFDRAMAEIDRDWQAADKLIERFRDKKFPPTDLEGVVLLHRMVDLKNEMAKLNREQARASQEGQREMAENARFQHDVMLDQLTELEHMVREMGTIQSAAFRMRQLIMQDDFTLANLIVRRETALNRKLKSEEVAELEKLSQDNARISEELAKKEAELEARAQEIEARAIAERAAKDQEFSPYVLKLAEDIVKSWDARADRARARLREKWSRTYEGLDPTILIDLSEIGVSHLAHAGLDFARWSARMVSDLGEFAEKARPYFEKAFARAKRLAEDEKSKRAGPKKAEVDRAIARPAPAEAIDGLVDRVGERFANNPQLDFSHAARQIARYYVEQGITKPMELVDAVHAKLVEAMPELTKRETMDALSRYGRFMPLKKDAVSVVLRDATGQMQQIAKLEDMAEGRAPLKSGPERRVPSDEERRLIKQVEEKKKEGGYDVTDPESQLRSALQAAERRMQNQIKDLLHEIQTRTKTIKNRRKLELDDRLRTMKEQLEFIREVHRDVFKPDPLTDAQRLAKWKERIQERKEEYLKRLSERDFAPRKRPEQPKLDKEAIQLRYDLHKVHNALMNMRIRDELSKRSKAAKVIGAAANLTRFQRALMSTGEFSAAFRQGGAIFASHPIISTRVLVESFKAFRSEKQQFRINEEIQTRDNAPSYQKDGLQFRESGVRLSTMEEVYMFRVSEALKKVDPNAGLPKRVGQHVTSKTLAAVEAFQRQFNTFLNKQAADVYDALVDVYGKEAGVDVANYINIANGRGSRGLGRWVGPGANTIFFAPRFAISRLQYLVGQPYWGAKTKAGKQMARREYARTFAGVAVIYALGIIAGWLNGQTLGETIEFDPRHPDFGKIRIGNSRHDPLFGLLQWMRLMARTLSGTTVNRKGKVRPLRESFRIGGRLPKRTATEPTGRDVAVDFVISKLAPYPAIAGRFLQGEAYGKPFNFKDELINAHTPMTYGDIYDTMVEHGIPKGVANSVPAMLGFGLQTYDENAKRGN